MLKVKVEVELASKALNKVAQAHAGDEADSEGQHGERRLEHLDERERHEHCGWLHLFRVHGARVDEQCGCRHEVRHHIDYCEHCSNSGI